MTGYKEAGIGSKTDAPKEKSVWVAYLLWFFLGVIAAHRFYLKRHGWLQLFTILLFGIGLLWVLADLFLIPGMVRQSRDGNIPRQASPNGGGKFLKVIGITFVAVFGVGIVAYILDPEAFEDEFVPFSQLGPDNRSTNENYKAKRGHASAEDKPDNPARGQSENKKYAQFQETVEGGRISSAVLSVSTTQRAGVWIFDEFIGETAQPGALFIVVEYEYTNISDGPIGSFNAPAVELVSPSGIEYKSDTGATAAEKQAREIEENFLSDLNPLITYRSLAVFEIAEQLYQEPDWEIKVKLDRGEFHVLISK